MAESKSSSKKEAKVNEFGQTEEQFKEAHGGRSPEEVYPPSEEVDEKHQKEKKEARWG